MKPGCNAKEHTIVHLRNRPISYIPGEYEKGMTKLPLAIDPTDPTEEMLPTSRLRFGKVVTVECNVKVRDIGMMIPEHKSKLLEYYREEQDKAYEPDDYESDVEVPGSTPAPLPFTHGGHTTPSSTQGAYYASNGSAYSTCSAPTQDLHGSYPSSGIHHSELQAYQSHPPYQYPPLQNPPYEWE
jgi:hypothetical protein